VRLTAAKSSLGRHGKLRLARPRAWTHPRPRKTDSASPDPGLGLSLDFGRRTPPRPTQGSDSASTSEDVLRLAQPRARTQPRPQKTDSASPDPRARTQPQPRKTVSASLDPGLGLSLDPGRQTPPRPTPGLGLSLGLGRRSSPRPTLGPRIDLDLGGASASPDLGPGPATSQGAPSLPYS
jgi:hypothetical protein